MKRYFFLFAFLTHSCATKEGTLTLDKEGRVTRLDENFKTLARLGKTPIPIPRNERIVRYALKTSGRPTEFLIVVEPYRVDGEMKLPTISSNNYLESASQNHQYYDLLLRAQRQIKKGFYKDAEDTIERINEDYDPSFATYVLLGNISVIRGEVTKAQSLYKKAYDLFKDVEVLKQIVE